MPIITRSVDVPLILELINEVLLIVGMGWRTGTDAGLYKKLAKRYLAGQPMNELIAAIEHALLRQNELKNAERFSQKNEL